MSLVKRGEADQRPGFGPSEESEAMRLVRESRKGLLRVLFSRAAQFTILILLQLGILVGVFYYLQEYLPHALLLHVIIMAAAALYIINGSFDPSPKLTWLLVVFLFPVSGVLLLVIVNTNLGNRRLKEEMQSIVDRTKCRIPQTQNTLNRMMEYEPEMLSLSTFINKSGCYPVYENTDVRYFPLGDDMFPVFLEELRKAERFIFLEFFIIHEGYMWGSILSILAEKAKQGLEVRVCYDGTCEFALLPHDYPERLAKLGIKCRVFSPIKPFISTHYNYRNHRKIAVIDGKVGFTGGVNLSDEYINRREVYGHWKDTAVMLRGKAVRTLTLMFLQNWGLQGGKANYGKYLKHLDNGTEDPNGLVLPFGDSPLDDKRVGELVYMDILNRSEHYVHIMTPYLILDGEMETALKFAAGRGVDVRIIVPGIPDKKIAYALCQGHYRTLIDAGVKIYEYTPGFVHAKVVVSDNETAVVGTINFDYRSFYHHFECAVYMHGTSCIGAVEADFMETLKLCREVNGNRIRQRPMQMKVLGILAKAVAPLM